MNATKKGGYLSWVFKWSKGGKGVILLLSIVTVCVSIVPTFVSYMMRDFVNIAMGETSKTFVQTMIKAILIVLLWGTLYIITSILKNALICKTEGNLRSGFLESVFTGNLIDIQKVHTGEMMTLLTNDVSAVSGFFTNLISGVAGNIALSLFSVITLFILYWKLAIILLVSVPILIVALNVFSPLIQKLSKINKADEEKNRTYMQDCVGKLLLFKAYSMTEKVIEGNNASYAQKRKSAFKLSVTEGVSGFMNIFFGMSMFLIVLGGGAYFAQRGEVTVGTLIAMLQVMNNVVNPFSAASQYISQIAQSKASIDRLKNVMELPHESPRISNSIIRPTMLKSNSLRFSYDGNEVLKGVSIEAKTAEKVGIIGESGSGKSTLTKLLMGLYSPESGTVELLADNGAVIDDILTFVSFVPSDNFLFSGTIKENICMNQDMDYELLESAAQAAKIHDFIMSLPKAYDEVIGEGSNVLSSGQAQRIGIARALYKNSPVLIFDEPTSNLDGDTIGALLETICDVAEEKLCLIITHDAATMGICDKIYRLKDGTALIADPA